MAIATNKGEKVTEEQKQEIERWVLCTLAFTSIVLTYFTFFVVDLKSQPWKQTYINNI